MTDIYPTLCACAEADVWTIKIDACELQVMWSFLRKMIETHKATLKTEKSKFFIVYKDWMNRLLVDFVPEAHIDCYSMCSNVDIFETGRINSLKSKDANFFKRGVRI